MRAFFVAAIAALALTACSPPPPTESEAPVAETALPAGITLSEPWAAPTPGGVDVSAGYLTISNGGEAEDQLIAAASPRAERMEIHQMTMDGGVMRMRAMEALPIPAGGVVTLEQGGMHLMFFGVSEPFTQGETVPVTLSFANAGDITVSLQVRAGATHGGH